MSGLLIRGHIITMDPSKPRASALYASDGKIQALDEEAVRMARLDTAGGSDPQTSGIEVIELGQRTLIPGLTDAHHHMAQSAAQGAWIEVSPKRCPTTSDIFETLKSAPKTTWVIAWGADETLQPGPLTRKELSEAVPDRPCVIVHSSYHHCWANDLALEICGISESTPDPEGGRIDRDRRGRPTGLLFDSAMTLVFQPSQKASLEDPQMDWAGLVRAHEDRMLSYGFTYLCDACAPPEFEELYRSMAGQGAIRIPMTVCPTGSEGFFVLPETRLEGAPTGEREGPLVMGPMKIFIDGATRCAVELKVGKTLRAAARQALKGLRTRNFATVAMLADTTVPVRLSKGKLQRGHLFVDLDAYRDFIHRATARGFGIITHALGNRAARSVMEAYETLDDPVGTPRLEHVTIADPKLIEDLGRSGFGVATQPGFIDLFPWMADLPLPDDISVVPVRSLLESGTFLAFSTDQPSGEPDPWIGLSCAVSRTNPFGATVTENEAVGPETALALFTREAARLSGYDGGVLAPGRPADFVMLNTDPLADGVLADRKVRPVATWLGGELAWEKPASKA
jgi:predicted amidohydrolase YtcJ